MGGQGRRPWRALCVALLLLAGIVPAAATAQLRVEVLQTRDELDGPPAAAAVVMQADATRDAPAVLALPRREAGYWLRLTYEGAVPADSELRLLLRGPRAVGPVVFYPPLAAPRTVRDAASGGSALLRRGWVLALPHGWPAGAVAYLRINGAVTEPVRLQLDTVPGLVRAERHDTRLTMAVFTTLMLMAVAMFAVWLVFRDGLYLSYAGYVTCVAVFALMVSGDAAEMWGLAWLDGFGAPGRWFAATLAVLLQLVFTVRFLELHRRLPWGATAVQALAVVHGVLLLALLVGREHVADWYPVAGNVLLLVAIALVLACAALAWRRGAAYAGYYLVGWSPMIVLAASGAGRQLGLLPPGWSVGGLPMVALVQSAVLALALSRHAANRHRITLLARQSLERDPLTGALNRRVVEQMLDAWAELGGLGARRYGVLMLDIDRLRVINTTHGRAIGDAVLQQALARIRSLVAAEDTVARMEADSFAVVSEGRREDCELLAQRLADGFSRRPFRIDGHQIEVSISIGLAMSRRGESSTSLLARARHALDHARMAGDNAVSIAPGSGTGEHPAVTSELLADVGAVRAETTPS